MYVRSYSVSTAFINFLHFNVPPSLYRVFPVETDLMGLRAKTDFQASELERGEVLVPSETLYVDSLAS